MIYYIYCKEKTLGFPSAFSYIRANYKPGSVVNGHLSRMYIAIHLEPSL